MKVQAIIPTAGTGTRFQADLPKPFVELHGKPLCVYALEVFDAADSVDSVIVVGHSDKLKDLEDIIGRYGLKKVSRIVAGGDERRDSVYNGILALDEDTDMVVVHDGVRPLVTADVIERAIQACGQTNGVVAAVPVTSTIKRADSKTMTVKETVDREGLWEVQTPQVFRKGMLTSAHDQFRGKNPPDDAVMVESIGITVKIVQGDYRNIKITTPEDMLVAEAFLQGKAAS